ncbi:MAG: hypothetical protein GY788_25275, partial [bacterium]|nr:hypothetical protein [bacterium]
SVTVDLGYDAGTVADDTDLTTGLLAAIDAQLVAGVTRSGNTLTFDEATGFTGTTFDLDLSASDDAAIEGTEALTLELTTATNSNGTAAIGTATASTDITEIDQAISFSLSRDDASIDEEGVTDNTVRFTITLSQALTTGNSVTVDLGYDAGTVADDTDLTTGLLAAIDAQLVAGVTRSGNTLTFDEA